MRRRRLRNFVVRFRLNGMNDIGELDRILNEENRNIIGDKIVVAVFGIELCCKSPHIAGSIGRTARADYSGETYEDRRLHGRVLQKFGHRVLRNRFIGLKVPVYAKSTRMNDTLRNALMIEVGHFLAKMEILHQGRSPPARLKRIIGVGYANSLIGRKRLRFVIHAIIVQLLLLLRFILLLLIHGLFPLNYD